MNSPRSFPWPLSDSQYNAGLRQPMLILDARLEPGHPDPPPSPGRTTPMTVATWPEVSAWLQGLPPGTLPPIISIRSDITIGADPRGVVDMRGGWFVGPLDPGEVLPNDLPILTLEGLRLSNVGGFRQIRVNVDGPTNEVFFGSVIEIIPLGGAFQTITFDNVQVRVANGGLLFALYGGGPNNFTIFMNNTSVRQLIDVGDTFGRFAYAENLGVGAIVATGLSEVDQLVLESDAATQGGFFIQATSAVAIGAQPLAPNVNPDHFEQTDRFNVSGPGVAALVFDQLGADAGGNVWISQAWAVNLGVQPVAGDTITLRDDLNNIEETWTWVVGPANPGELTIGGNANESRVNLCNTIASEGVLWGAADGTLPYNLPAGADNLWCVIYRRTQDQPSFDDLLRASFTNAPGLQVIDLSPTWFTGSYATGQNDVNDPTSVQAADERRLFGFGLTFVRAGTEVSLLDNTATNPLVGRATQPSPGVTYTAIPTFGSGDPGQWVPSTFYAVSLFGNWVQPAPTDYKQALDRLASAVSELLASQIPQLS